MCGMLVLRGNLLCRLLSVVWRLFVVLLMFVLWENCSEM